MLLEDAFETVLDMARQACLNSREAGNDQDLLQEIRKQEEAITVLQDFFTNHVFNDDDLGSEELVLLKETIDVLKECDSYIYDPGDQRLILAEKVKNIQESLQKVHDRIKEEHLSAVRDEWENTKDLADVFEKVESHVANFVENECHLVKATALGLDRRCGDIYVCKDAIIVPKERFATIQYYGAMEYVDQENRKEMGDYIFYLKEDSRVANHLDMYFNKKKEED